MTRVNKIEQNFIAMIHEKDGKPGYQVTSTEYGIFLGKYTRKGFQSLGKFPWIRFDEDECLKENIREG